jgi:hypothetical protein
MGMVQTFPKFRKSSDRGATRIEVNVGTGSDGARGNSDVDLAAGLHGALYFVALTYDPKLAEGTAGNGTRAQSHSDGEIRGDLTGVSIRRLIASCSVRMTLATTD